jgi:hypothetical protein
MPGALSQRSAVVLLNLLADPVLQLWFDMRKIT